MIEIREAKLEDQKKAYDWLFFSDFPPSLYGGEGSTPETIPSFEEFKEGYENYYFDGSHPEEGRCFIIVLKENGRKEDIGIITYTSFHLWDKITEFDIWLKELRYTGQGYGTQAILKLALLVKDLGYEKVIMRPSKYNKIAIKSYKKAGFRKEDLNPYAYCREEYIEECEEGYSPAAVFMVLHLNKESI